MGIDLNGLNFILDASKGKNFKKVLTIGRQNLNVKPNVLGKVLKRSGYTIKSDLKYEYADDLFFTIGFDKIDSIDYSDYERANIIWDMNYPVAEDLKRVYDIVFDGGSLEHVFNLPIALKNCMELVKIGGVFIINTPANNYIGHGFYQFSPELFYRTLNEKNGFQIISMYFVDMNTNKWIFAEDPKKINKRIELQSINPLLLFVAARKTEEMHIFDTSTLQSDYCEAWKNEMTLSKKIATFGAPNNTRLFLKKAFPKFYNILRLLLRGDQFIQ